MKRITLFIKISLILSGIACMAQTNDSNIQDINTNIVEVAEWNLASPVYSNTVAIISNTNSFQQVVIETNSIEVIFNGTNIVISTPERYVLIVERDPFGSAPASADSIIRMMGVSPNNWRLSFIYEDTDEVYKVAFTRNNAPVGEFKSIILEVGDYYEDMQLVEVDVKEGTASFLQNGQLISLQPEKPSVQAQNTTRTQQNQFTMPAFSPNYNNMGTGGGNIDITISDEPMDF